MFYYVQDKLLKCNFSFIFWFRKQRQIAQNTKEKDISNWAIYTVNYSFSDGRWYKRAIVGYRRWKETRQTELKS